MKPRTRMGRLCVAPRHFAAQYDVARRYASRPQAFRIAAMLTWLLIS